MRQGHIGSSHFHPCSGCSCQHINLKKNLEGEGLERKTKIIPICSCSDHFHRKPQRIYKYLKIIDFNKIAQ